MKKVIFYTKENCLLCDEASDLIKVIQEIEPFELEVKDIYENDTLLEKYQLIIPVVRIDKEDIFGDAIDLHNILQKLKRK